MKRNYIKIYKTILDKMWFHIKKNYQIDTRINICLIDTGYRYGVYLMYSISHI